MLKIILFLSIILVVSAYAIAWLASRRVMPVSYGISFSHQHAAWLGLDWKEAYSAALRDLGPSYVRLSARWNDVEPARGKWSYEDTDWLFDEAKRRGVKVLLTVGQKHPRWPECYIPAWAMSLPEQERRDALLGYVKKTVERYRNHPALEFWQVENEPFIGFPFGECSGFDKGAVPEEASLVRSLDPRHMIVATDSGEMGTWRAAARLGDIFGSTLYRTVTRPSGFSFAYDWLPAGHYRLKAWLLRIPYERFFIAELQAEPWLRTGDPRKESVSEQERSFNVGRFEKNLDYVKRVGASRAYLWGAEWWYWMKKEKNDPRYWEMAKKAFAEE